MTLHAKMAMPDLQGYLPWNLDRIENGEETVVFWLEKCWFLWVSPSYLINNWKALSQKSNSYLIKKAFKDTIVNRALPFFHGGSYKITLTVLLSSTKYVTYNFHAQTYFPISELSPCLFLSWDIRFPYFQQWKFFPSLFYLDIVYCIGYIEYQVTMFKFILFFR